MAEILQIHMGRINASLPLIIAITLTALIAVPVITVFVLAFISSEGVLIQLISTVLPRYLINTLVLMFAVGFLAAVIGSSTAWLVTMYEFPFRRILGFALFLPLAMPAYIGAYALVDFFEYAGPFQSMLRQIFGWTNAQDYFFPEIRSLPGATLVLSSTLYPYVYLFVRIALREQSTYPHDVARTLGAGPLSRFFRVGLSMTRPSIVAGMAIVMMETISDFGVVEYFAVQTLTTGIFSIWLDSRNIGGAAQLALIMLFVMSGLVLLDRVNRRRMRFTRMAGSTAKVNRFKMKGILSVVAPIVCLLPLAIGFILPVAVISSHAFDEWNHWLDEELFQSMINTIITGGSATLLAIIAAVVMVYSVQLSKSIFIAFVSPISTLGYAIPGAVLGLGLLFPLAAADHQLADIVLYFTGFDPGLLLTGSAIAVIIAYCTRFFAIAHGSAETALDRVSPSLQSAARSLGKSPISALIRVYLPLIRGSLLTGFVLVFVDCVKELPATLLLRPFDFNTLATRVYERASLENLSEAAPAALLVTCVGALGVLFLMRTTR